MRRHKLQVKEVATLANVSVRTLHHYDEIGLLVPNGRTEAGYRLYDDDDLFRLQQIVIGRELGLSLEEVRRSLDDPRFDRKAALLLQKKQLEERHEETTRMIRAVDAALAILDGEGTDDAMNMKHIFDGFDSGKHGAEARARWGKTDAYAESTRRTKKYVEAEWRNLQAEQASIYGDAATAKAAGKSPSDEAVTDIAERHRLSIDRWFYPCSLAMHEELADMYEADPRFGESIDRHGAGLTSYLAEAIRANRVRRRDP